MIALEKEEIKFCEVEFKLTNKCNLKCLHCAPASDMNNRDLLSTGEVIIILDKILKMNVGRLLITGGEPLIRKDIKYLLNYTRKNYKGTINLITNGTFIDKEMALVLKKCVDAVSISLDGYDKESTDFIRGKGVYDRIINAIYNLKEVGFDKETIDLTMVSTSQNFNHEDEFYSLCEKLGVAGRVSEFFAKGRGLANFHRIGLKDLEETREHLECKTTCTAGVNKIMINEKGDLYPSLILGSDEYKFGNVLYEELSDIFSRLGVNNSLYNNEDLREERCRKAKPHLSRLLWYAE